MCCEAPSLDWLRGNWSLLKNGTDIVTCKESEWRAPWDRKILSGEDMLADVIKHDFQPTNSLIRREFLNQHNIRFEERLALLEDVPFINHILAEAKQCMWLQKEVYVYRVGAEGSLTNTPLNYKKIESLARFPGLLKGFRKKYGRKGRRALNRFLSVNAIWALYHAARRLSEEQCREIFQVMKEEARFLPIATGSPRCNLYVILFNISPWLARVIMRFFNHGKTLTFKND